MKRIFIIAGDLSGDFHGARLAKKIKELSPETEIYSAGGRHLQAQTVSLLRLTEIAVTGIFEVAEYLPKIIRYFNKIISKAGELKPDIIILIDFPDFNLRLAKKLKKKNFKMFYYISPQVWAWRKKRIQTIKNTVEKMMVIFPFEKDFYEKEGIKATYVGHPLVKEIDKHLKKNQETGLEKEKKQIAFLPGSRKKEVKKHLPPMIKTKKMLEKENLEFVLIKHPHLSSDLFKTAEGENIIISDKDKFGILSKTDIAVSSSGTATLELALMNIPTVVIYKTGFLSWLILKSMVDTEFISIVNILGKEQIYPELIQNKANPSDISKACQRFLQDEHYFRKTKQKLKNIKNTLGEKQASETAAREIIKKISD